MKEFLTVFTLCWLVIAAKFYFFPENEPVYEEAVWEEPTETFEQFADEPEPVYNQPEPVEPPPPVYEPAPQPVVAVSQPEPEPSYRPAPQPSIPQKAEDPHANRPDGTLSPEQFRAKQAEHIVEDITKLLDCVRGDVCQLDLPKSSYGGQMFYRSTQINEKFNELINLGVDAIGKEKWEGLVNDFMDSDNGNVKIKAVEMLSQLPPKPEYAERLMTSLQESDNVPMLKKAMEEMQRYPENAEQLEYIYSDILRSDRTHVAEHIAAGIGAYINKENIYTYEGILSELPPNSRVALKLNQAIQGYRARQPH
jgi:hypothetical protein